MSEGSYIPNTPHLRTFMPVKLTHIGVMWRPMGRESRNTAGTGVWRAIRVQAGMSIGGARRVRVHDWYPTGALLEVSSNARVAHQPRVSLSCVLLPVGTTVLSCSPLIAFIDPRVIPPGRHMITVYPVTV